MAHATKAYAGFTSVAATGAVENAPADAPGRPLPDQATPSPHDELTPDSGPLGDHGDAAAKEAHDRSTHGPNKELFETGFGRFLVWLGKLHPAAVHFPIAFLLGAAFAELLSRRFDSRFFCDAARFSLWLGALGALGAAILGWLYGGFRLFDEEIAMNLHRWNGTGVAVFALLTLWLHEKRTRAGVYRTALFATALLAGVNGYLGGVLVYGPEQHQWPVAAADQVPNSP